MKPSDHSPSGSRPHAAPGGESLRPADPGAPLPPDVRLSARWAWGLILAFLVMITLPGVLRELSADPVRGAMAAVFQPGAETVAKRLRGVEKQVDDGAWTQPVRERMQTALERVFGAGNRKVLVGRDGWLFHRPGVQALTGRGPVLGPTHSVAKDPALKQWEGPIPVIRDFAAQLKERGIRLVLVPVPDKAAVHSRLLKGAPASAGPARRRHPDGPALAEALRGHADVVDLGMELPYLPDDTHWEASGARTAAAAVAAIVHPASSRSPDPVSAVEVAGTGDLVTSLGLVAAAARARQTTVRVLSTSPLQSDPTSPVVLLGDSNVNMYDDPGLPFHHPGAGFGSWLSASLGGPLHVLAINGGGATQVRQRFAALPDDVVRAKKTVIWVLAERDLFMDPPVAQANGVEWKRVAFNPRASAPAGPAASAGALVIEATLRATSEVLDMASVNYPDAVFTAEFTVDRVVSGAYAEKELSVVLWNFRGRIVQPTARLTAGRKVRLTLVPWLDQGDLTKINLSDDFQRFDLPLLYAEKAEVLGE
jgi:hypothetical protein